jgi:hypothetical protein
VEVDGRIRHNFDKKRFALALYLSGSSVSDIQRAIENHLGEKISFCVINNWLIGANLTVSREIRARREKDRLNFRKKKSESQEDFTKKLVLQNLS